LDSLHDLQQEYTKQVQDHMSTMDWWAKKYQCVAKFWRYHSVPRLDLFEAVFAFPKAFAGHRQNWSQIANAMVDINLKLECVVDGMGTHKLHSESMVEYDLLPLFEQQVAKSNAAIANAAARGEVDEIERCLDCFCDLIIVCIKRAKDLPDMDKSMFSAAGDVTDGYVQVRFGNQKRENGRRTKTIWNDLNPVWEETFSMVVPPGETNLVLEVLDSDEDHGVNAPSKDIGHVSIPFRSFPGEFVDKVENLSSFNTKVGQMSCTIEFSYCFVDSFRSMPGVQSDGQCTTSRSDNVQQSVSNFLRIGRYASASSSQPHVPYLPKRGQYSSPL